ncbi:MAG: hypothetical protein SGILL_003740 [Bacillariaceae sp.]
MELFGEKSMRDVVGGDQHAEEVLQSHERKVEREMRKERVKEGRRNDVKNSLASFLQARGEEDDSIADEAEHLPDELGDESLISDEEEERTITSPHKRSSPNKHSSFKRHDSLGSRKSARQVTRTTRTIDNETTKTGSNHSRKSVATRARVQRIRSKAADDNKKSGSSENNNSPTQSNRSRRPVRVRRTGAESGDDHSVDASSRRRRSRVRSIDPEERSVTSSRRDRTSIPRPRSVDASVRRHRSRSRGADSARVPRRRRSSSRARGGDDDDKSVCSKMSVTASSRRGRRPGKGPQATKQNDDSQNGKNSRPSPPASPNQKERHDYMSRSMPSLDSHIQSEPQTKHRSSNMDDLSEEGSRYSNSTNCTPVSVLLQFDPTNEDLIQAISQSTAKKTTETIRHKDGTETKFQVSELAGLPTFEKPPSEQSLTVDLNASLQSISVGDLSTEEVEEVSERPRSTTRRTLLASLKSELQNPGEAPSEPSRRAPRASKSSSSALAGGLPPRRGNLQATKSMSFMQRVNNRRAQFEGMMNRSTRAIEHQELDDDGSDHD